MHHVFLDEGKGPAVLLLHGALPDGRCFARLVAALAGTHRVLVPTSQGYGGTPPPTRTLTMAEHVEALLDDVLALGISSLSVVGTSAGGYRALAVALSPRVRTERAFVLSGFAGLPPPHRASLRELAGALRAGADVAPVAAPTMFAPSYVAAHPEAIASLVAQMREVPAAVLAAEFEAAAASEDLLARLSTLRAPLWLRVGDADVAVPKERSEEIAAVVPHATLEIVHDAGHALLEEDAEATVSAVVRALEATPR
jgi:pimeloyl-ACP methyl ester carboxylesterase